MGPAIANPWNLLFAIAGTAGSLVIGALIMMAGANVRISAVINCGRETSVSLFFSTGGVEVACSLSHIALVLGSVHIL